MSLSILPGIDSSGSALDAERLRLNIIANNIANANTTRTADGQPYRRQMVMFESVLAEQTQSAAGSKANPSTQPLTVRVRSIVDDPRPFQKVYQPGHPHAGPDGMVELPNVNVAEEMVDMITASRSIEANVQVITSAKQMARSAIDLSRI